MNERTLLLCATKARRQAITNPHRGVQERGPAANVWISLNALPRKALRHYFRRISSFFQWKIGDAEKNGEPNRGDDANNVNVGPTDHSVAITTTRRNNNGTTHVTTTATASPSAASATAAPTAAAAFRTNETTSDQIFFRSK